MDRAFKAMGIANEIQTGDTRFDEEVRHLRPPARCRGARGVKIDETTWTNPI